MFLPDKRAQPQNLGLHEPRPYPPQSQAHLKTVILILQEEAFWAPSVLPSKVRGLRKSLERPERSPRDLRERP